jgi:hypothetical protein
MVDVRYGVIQYDDIVRDLKHWETMLVSTLMQRPIKTIVKNDEVWEHQMRNLKSAVSPSYKIYIFYSWRLLP